MTAPRLEIDLGKIHHNARFLNERLHASGIEVTAVTKAVYGMPEVARTLLRAGVRRLADARVENIETMRGAGIDAPIALVRSPMLSQADRVVAAADVSYNTEFDIISALSTAAKRASRVHGVVLMVELGDFREGIMPGDLESAARETLRFPNIELKGVGANLCCLSGVPPDARKMAELSHLADAIEAAFGLTLEIVSGGNSANLEWAFSGADTGRINDLRLGEAILLGMDPLHGRSIPGLHTDAVTLVGEVIEAKLKPSRPWSDAAASRSSGSTPGVAFGSERRVILALGRQDTDIDGLEAPRGVRILSASSDHLVVDDAQRRLSIGSEVAFGLNYSALMRTMRSPSSMNIVTRRHVPRRAFGQAALDRPSHRKISLSIAPVLDCSAMANPKGAPPI